MFFSSSNSPDQLTGRILLTARTAGAVRSFLLPSLLSIASVFIVSALQPAAGAKEIHCKRADESSVTWWTEKQPNGHRWVKAKISIDASPTVIWSAIRNEQKQDGDLEYSRVISTGPGYSTSEQKYVHLPIIGTAHCTMRTEEVPLKRIAYTMLKSDRFKCLEGSWVLLPGDTSNSSYLELSSYCDIGLPVPRALRDGITSKKLIKRLINVKHNAEYSQMEIAQKQPANES